MKKKVKMRCRLCNSTKIKPCLKLSNMPRNISKLLRQKELKRDNPVNLVVYNCQECGFVQLIDRLALKFYDDYMMAMIHSSQMRAHQYSQTLRFVKGFKLKGKRIIEIGCGDGSYLEYLRELGVHVTGIEPSRKARNIALAKGLRVFPGYINRKRSVAGVPYDAFVTRQVLEHVPDPNDFLQGIRLLLADGAVGLVEVPNLDKTLQYKRFYDFFPDHMNYFSPRTLRFALERNGFSVLNIKTGMDREYLEAYVKVSSQIDPSSLQETVNNLIKRIHALISNAHKDGKKVAVWGSGAKGVTLLAVSRIEDIEYVIDSDRYKQSLFTPVSHLPIVSPDYICKNPVDIIIITAMAFHSEIIKLLRHDLGFKGTIVSLYKLSRPKWSDRNYSVKSLKRMV